MTKRILLTLTLIPLLAFGKSTYEYNVCDYGAKPDTAQLSTKAIQKAIDACARAGGGKVVFPAGSYKAASLFLRSHVYLYLAPGATLYGSRNIGDYTPVKPEFVSLRTTAPVNALIYAENIHDAGICGEGTIDGQGDAYPRLASEPDERAPRPTLLRFVCCEKISVRDVQLQNSGFWMQHYLACRKLNLTNLRIYNHATKNNDAVDLDGCSDVVVSGLICDTDDDGITLKSTCPLPSENIVINNCIVSSHCNAIKAGTESNGGFRNITISNCVIRPSEAPGKIFGYPGGISGISLEMVDGGTLEGVNISNVLIRGAEVPLYIRLGNRARPYVESVPVEKVGILRQIRISNLTALDAGTTGCSFTGIPQYRVEDIEMENVCMEFAGGVSEGDYNPVPDECEKCYPEATGMGKMPAYGLFVRHARNVKLHNVTLRSKETDARPSTLWEDVEER